MTTELPRTPLLGSSVNRGDLHPSSRHKLFEIYATMMQQALLHL
jgi:hypothetical protein